MVILKWIRFGEKEGLEREDDVTSKFVFDWIKIVTRLNDVFGSIYLRLDYIFDLLKFIHKFFLSTSLSHELREKMDKTQRLRWI